MEKPGHYVLLLTAVAVILSQSYPWQESGLTTAVDGYVHPAFQKVYDVFKNGVIFFSSKNLEY
uniref:Uncharacterized protein n=1 Tax=Magallana gigas TaxID=29159 RepID=A0A8W8HS04_MAGGI